MKIGIFDSGVGGLVIAKAIRKAMPQYDYVYLGDTKRVPYGNRSHQSVFEFSKECVDYLFKKENCAIVIVACNTASARALRRLQREYLPTQKHVSHRSILGVLIPSAEEAGKFKRVGVLATHGTVSSNSFPREIKKANKNTIVFQNPAPMLVPLAEEGEKKRAGEFIKEYLAPFKNKKLDALVLGCTHYPIFKKEIRKILNEGNKSAKGRTRIISQDEIVPKKLKDYFTRHPEVESKLSKTPNQSKARYGARGTALGHRPMGKAKILVTDLTPQVLRLSKNWFGKNTKPKLIHL